MPCDAACRKLIINSMFIAPIALILSERTGSYNTAASRLFDAATLHNDVVDVARKNGTLRPLDKSANFAEFNGCEQAAQLLAWVRKPPVDAEVQVAIETMNAWADLLYENALAIVSGTAT